MGKIERAIRKSQETRLNHSREASEAPPPYTPDIYTQQPIPTSRSLTIAPDAIATKGLLPPRAAVERIAKQFGTVKRPIIDNARQGAEAEASAVANVLMVTSAESGEGKTFCSFNLAMSISREREVQVMLIDADVLSPKLTHALGAKDEPGLMDYLSSPKMALEDIVIDLPEYRMTFVPAGAASEHAHELLASRRMDALIQELSARHPGILILDTPPLLATNEAAVIASHVGQVMLVVGAGTTPQSSVLEAASMIPEAIPLNLLLNKQRGGSGRYGSYGAYGAYAPS